MTRRADSAFTLVEVAMAMAVLTIGLTAVTTVYLTSLRWASETRTAFSMFDVAHQIADDPSLLCSDIEGSTPAGFRVDDELARGWYQRLYVVRRRLQELPVTVPTVKTAVATEYVLRIAVYGGGTDDDGELLTTLRTRTLVWNE